MPQATYRDIPALLARTVPFEGNTMSAQWEEGHTVYRVYSYSTCIAEYRPYEDGGTLHATVPTYSVTSARHQSLARAWTALYSRQYEVDWFDLRYGARRLVA